MMDAIMLEHGKESLSFFLFTMVELAVLFVGISFLVGVINEFLPQEKVKAWLSGRNGRGYLIGSLLGGLTPFCSCSTIPVTVGLLKAGAGFGPTMAFLFTSPLVNPIIIPLFFTLLGPKITLVYALVAIVMTIAISYLLQQLGFSRYLKKEVLGSALILGEKSQSFPVAADLQPACCGISASGLNPLSVTPGLAGGEAGAASQSPGPRVLPFTIHQGPVKSRWRRIFDDAVEQFRKLLPFVILGVAIGSIIHGFLPAEFVAAVAGTDNPLAVPASALLGIPLYLRATTMVPIAASLIAKGMSVGAVIALIIGGAGASLPEVAMLKGLFKIPLLLAFLASVMLMAVSAGFLTNWLLI